MHIFVAVKLETSFSFNIRWNRHA